MKNIFYFLIFTVFIACNNNDKLPNTKSENKKIITTYFEYFNTHDWAKMAGMYAQNTACKDPTLGKGIVMQTRQQFVDKYTELHNIFSNLHDSITEMYVAENNTIIVEFTSSGTAEDGSTFALPICTIFTIQNGLITKDYTYFDNFEVEKK